MTSRLKIFVQFCLLALLVGGCGGGGGSSQTANVPGTSPPLPSTPPGAPTVQFATIEVAHQLLARAVPSYIEQFRCVGLSASGQTVYGPIIRGKSSRFTLANVPVEVTTLRIEYLQNGALRGLGRVRTVLQPGQTFLIEDPPFDDVNAVVESISLDPAIISLPAGRGQSLSVTGTFNTGEIEDVTSLAIWSSDDEGVAVVDAAGHLSALSVGSTTISVRVGELEKELSVSVSDAVLESILINEDALTLPKGLTFNLSAEGVFSDGSRTPISSGLNWTTEDSNIATVIDGQVKAINLGQTIISVSTPEGVSDSLTVQVQEAALHSVRIEQDDQALPKGTSSQLKALASYSDLTEVDVTAQVLWSSSNTGLVTVGQVSEPGLLSAIQLGETTVRADFGNFTDSIRVTVTPAELVTIDIEPGSDTLAAGLFVQLIPFGIYTDGTRVQLSGVSWRSAEEAIALVSSSGRVTTLAEGQTDIEATLGDVTGDFRLTVTNTSLEQVILSKERIVSLPIGVVEHLTVEGVFSDGSRRDMSGQVFWSTREPSVAGVTAQGAVSGRSEGRTRLRVASPLGPSDEIDVTVSEAMLTNLRIVSPENSPPVGVTVRFTAEGTYSDGTTRDLTYSVSWLRDNPSVGSFNHSQKGFFQTEASGNTTISARATQNGVSFRESLEFEVVESALEEILISPEELSVPRYVEHRFSALGKYANGIAYDISDLVVWSWDGSNPMYMSNSGSSIGVLKNTRFRGSGSVVATYRGLTGRAPVSIVDATVASVSVSPAEVTLSNGHEVAFQGAAQYTNGYVEVINGGASWRSGDNNIASTSSDGRTRANSIGSTTVTLTYKGASEIAALQVTDAALEELRIVPSSVTLPQGLRYRFLCQGRFSDESVRDVTDQITWSSESPQVASLSNTAGEIGTMRTFEPGTTIVTALEPTSGLTNQCAVNIEQATLVSIRLDSGPTFLRTDTNRCFKAEGVSQNGKVFDLTQCVEWQSSRPDIAPIGNDPFNKGKIQAITGGETTLTLHEPSSGLMTQHLVDLSDTTLVDQIEVMTGSYLQHSPDGSRLYLMGPERLETRATTDLSLLDSENFFRGEYMDVSPDGQSLLYTGWNFGGVSLIDQRTFQRIFYPIAGVTDTNGIAFKSNSEAYVSTDEGFYHLDLSSGNSTHTGANFSDFARLGFDPVTEKLVAGIDSNLHIFEPSGFNLTAVAQQGAGGGGKRIKFRPGGGQFVYCVGAGNELYQTREFSYLIFLYNIFDLEHYISYLDPGIFPADADFSPDGSVLYAVNGDYYDQRVYLFCSETGRELGHISPEFGGLGSNISSVELSPDGRTLYLIYDRDRKIYLAKYRVR